MLCGTWKVGRTVVVQLGRFASADSFCGALVGHRPCGNAVSCCCDVRLSASTLAVTGCLKQDAVLASSSSPLVLACRR